MKIFKIQYQFNLKKNHKIVLQKCILTLLHNKAMMGADKRSLRLIGRQNILQSF